MSDKSKKIPEKAIQLIEYFTELARINAKIVRSHDAYKKVFWIHDIPQEPKYCFTHAWGQEEGRNDDVWIEIKKIQAPPLPEIPSKCLNWVNHANLRNINELPALYESIVVKRIEQDPETEEENTITETLELLFFPGIQTAWDNYLEQHWKSWTILQRQYISIQKVYAALFHIYQEQQKHGERYELVFCLGLLNWKTKDDHDVKRHIVVTRASLEFEPLRGMFTVRQAVDDDLVDIGVDIELDMLASQPRNNKQLIDNGRKAIGANLWDRVNVDATLTSIVNSLADEGQGEYYPDRLQPKAKAATVKPIIEYAPALILRKRSMRGLESLLASMKTQIGAGGTIPDEFLNLCESLPARDHEQADSEQSTSPSKPVDEEIYFPLPANEEQRRIIRTLDSQQGVLVQGPPGTGKSHTIANLICHLLATGQRVLVTAKTPCALQVLHEKLPSEIQPLCINLLGQGAEERESLEKSVSGILTRQNHWDEIRDNDRIQRLEARIDENRRGLAETNNTILALREKETFKHALVSGKYSGTAARIARALRKDADTFSSWFTDGVNVDTPLPLSQKEKIYLCKYLVRIDQNTESDLERQLPDLQNLPPANKVTEAFQQEAAARTKAEKGQERLHTLNGKLLFRSGREKVKSLFNSLSAFTSAHQAIRQKPMPWIDEAVNEVLAGQDSRLRTLLSLSRDSIRNIHSLAAKVDAVDVKIPDNMGRKKILFDAEGLLEHFESGGKAVKVFGVFVSPTVKKHGDLIGKVTVDDLDCNSLEPVQKLVDFLTVEQQLNYVWGLWSGKAERHSISFLLQIAEIDELHTTLEKILQLHGNRENVKKKLSQIRELKVPQWSDSASVRSLLEDCRVILAQIDFKTINDKIEKAQKRITVSAAHNNAHLITNLIVGSFQKRDAACYCRLLEETAVLAKKAKQVRVKKQLIAKLAQAVPDFAGNLTSGNDVQLWVKRLTQFDKAWAWAQGASWLDDFLKADLVSLEKKSRRHSEEIKEDLAELAAVKAWQFCFSRLGKDHKQNLMAWQQTIRKIGKGTGKYADKYRKDAQQYLNGCRTAVPAWVMPLHRVYETVKAEGGVFDVIIVDEASQCGSEGLPLLYLGKRVLVVGDDKQISPEAVGVNIGNVQQLMQNHLSGFKFATTFSPESSLFDHGLIRFSSRISLKEHFRCMPEIIRFSNNLCYQSDPLIPLRQYPPDRLEPLKAVHVTNGHRKGTGQRVINEPEAEALVETIARCCNDDCYKGMTMGVIVLQGTGQAYLIEGLLLKKIGAKEIEKRKLICGNSYSFQGDERDIMFLSMVAAPNETPRAITAAPDERRFNVAASRAREQMWLFHSVTTNHLSKKCLRRRLLEHFLNPATHINTILGENVEELREKAYQANRLIEKAPNPFDSWFELDVALKIAGQGYRVAPQYKFAGKRIDLVVLSNTSQQLAVECDGDHWHGRDRYAADMERQRMLERCGWHFFRIRESRYYADPDKSLEPLWKLLEQQGIMPGGMEVEPESEPVLEPEPESGQAQVSKPENKNSEKADALDDEESMEESKSYKPKPKPTGVKESSPVKPANAGHPETIQQALKVDTTVIHTAIIQVLEERPNNSCLRKDMTKFVLKLWHINTRGNPRQQFAKRVDSQIVWLDGKKYIKIYQTTNERVKLGQVKYMVQGNLLNLAN